MRGFGITLNATSTQRDVTLNSRNRGLKLKRLGYNIAISTILIELCLQIDGGPVRS